MENQNFTVGEIIKGGANLGLKNLLAIIVNFILFVLTCWIPYVNIGTFIGITSGIPLKMSKGEVISFTEIFNANYRKNFGEYFILMGLMMVAIYFGLILFIIPAIILGYVWYISDLLFLDGKAGIMEALTKSNDLTYGKKMTIFLANLVFILIFTVGYMIGVFISAKVSGFLGGIIIFAVVLFLVPFTYGIKAYVYQQLVGKE